MIESNIDINILNDHFNLFVASMNAVFDKTSLKFEIITKLRNEFNQLINEIKPLLSYSNKIKSVPFERSMVQLSSLCQRIFFASNKSTDDQKAICQFFTDLNYPIDLSDQYLNDNDEYDDEDEKIIYLEFTHNNIFVNK